MTINHIHMFDIDGTVTTIEPIVGILQEKFPEFTVEHLTKYDIKQCLLEHGFINNQSKFNAREFLAEHPLLFLDGDTREHIQDYVAKLHSRGDYVEFVTARYFTDERYNYTLDWCNKHFPMVGFDKSKLHFIDAKHKQHHVMQAIVNAKKNKTKTTVHFYEDKADTLVNTSETFKRMNSLLNLEEYAELKLYKVITPYNKDIKIDNCTEIKCWKQMEELVNG